MWDARIGFRRAAVDDPRADRLPWSIESHRGEGFCRLPGPWPPADGREHVQPEPLAAEIWRLRGIWRPPLVLHNRRMRTASSPLSVGHLRGDNAVQWVDAFSVAVDRVSRGEVPEFDPHLFEKHLSWEALATLSSKPTTPR